jgi:hypothetical protein
MDAFDLLDADARDVLQGALDVAQALGQDRAAPL